MALWTPSNLSGVHIWNNAESITGLSDGDSVSSWPDDSGNGNTADQATSGQQPTWEDAELNSLPVVRFDGTNDNLSYGDVDDLDVGTGDFFLAFVIEPSAIGSNMTIFSKNSAAAGQLFRVQSAGKLQLYVAGTGSFALGTTVLSAGTAYVTIAERTSGTAQIWLNGTSEDTDANSNSVSNANPCILGGQSSGTTNTWQGDIAEVVAGGSSISTDDRQKLEGYLAWRYGLEGSLPVSHPYKSAAPTTGAVRSLFGGNQLFGQGLIR